MKSVKSLYVFIILLMSLVYAAHLAVYQFTAETNKVDLSHVYIDHSIFIIAFLVSGFILSLHKHFINTNHLFAEIYENSQKYLWLLILLCFFGGVLNAIDKYLIMQLRPITCIAEIRFAWIDVAAYMGRTPVHGAISFMGNALSSLLFPLVVILSIPLLNPVIIDRKSTVSQILVIISLALIYCGSFASRNLAFAFMAISFATVLLFFCTNPCKIQLRKTLLSSLTILALGLGFVYSISYDRMNCGWDDEGAGRLARNQVYLRAFEDEIPFTLNYASSETNCPICQLGAMYLSHGVANHIMVFNENKIGKNYLLGFVNSNLNKLFPLEEVKVSKYYRGGITMIGAIKHDFNFIGIIVFAPLLAVTLKLILLGLSAVRGSVRTFAFCMLSLYFYSITVSMLFFPVMTMPFKIMCFGFLLFWIFTIFVNWIDIRQR